MERNSGIEIAASCGGGLAAHNNWREHPMFSFVSDRAPLHGLMDLVP